MDATQDSDTIAGLLQSRVAATPNAVACCQRTKPGVWEPTTWSSLWNQVQNVATALHGMSLGKGDRVAILARTSIEWQISELASLLVGAVVVGVDSHASPEQIEHVLRHSDACCLVADDAMSKVSPSLLGDLRHVVSLDETAQPPDHSNHYTWDAISSATPFAGDSEFPPVGPDDPATLLYTSGTTGSPKAIEYTNGQLLVASRAIGRALPEIIPGDSTLCWLPMAHLFQRMMNLLAIDRGIITHFLEDPRDIMTCIGEVNPSLFVAVPRFYEKLHNGLLETISNSGKLAKPIVKLALNAGFRHAKLERSGERTESWFRPYHAILDALVLRKLRAVMGTNIKVMITGSAPTPPRILEFFHGIGLLILEAYGLSENTVPMASNLSSCYRFGSVGKPFPENEIQFAEDREILVRGPGVFSGYYGEEHATDLFTADRFYRSGDFGHMDEDGFLYLGGRKSEIIKTSTGRKISPTQIEAAYCQSPCIDQMVVVGDGRPYLVGLVVVDRNVIERRFVGANPHLGGHGDRPLDGSELIDLVGREIESFGQQLAPHERVLKLVILEEPFSVASGEVTPSQKIRRCRIAKARETLIDQLYDYPLPSSDKRSVVVLTEKDMP